MHKFLKVLNISFISVLMGLITIVPINALDNDNELDIQNQPSISIYDDDGDSTIYNVIYNEKGEIIEFFVSLKNQVPIVGPQSIIGIAKFLYGACKITAYQTGYNPCTALAKYLGLQLINGWYMMQNMKYTGTWESHYGYKPGCQPQHSGSCFGATYRRTA